MDITNINITSLNEGRGRSSTFDVVNTTLEERQYFMEWFDSPYGDDRSNDKRVVEWDTTGRNAVFHGCFIFSIPYDLGVPGNITIHFDYMEII